MSRDDVSKERDSMELGLFGGNMYKRVNVEIYIPVQFIGDVRESMLKSGHYRLSMLHGGEVKPKTESPCMNCRYEISGQDVTCLGCSRVGMGYFDRWEAGND